MQKSTSLVATAFATALAGTAAFAATQDAGTAAPGALATAANRDFTRVSKDGSLAFSDIGLARLAIYNGNTSQAATLVADAKQALGRAANDDSVYTKMENELHPPKAMPATTRISSSNAPVAWLPVDAQYVVDETLAPTPQTAAALDAANAHLRSNQPDQARDALKVADINASFTLAVAPLKSSVADVDQASTMMASKNYYGASQALRTAQVHIRYDIIDLNSVPKNAATAAAKPAATTAAN